MNDVLIPNKSVEAQAGEGILIVEDDTDVRACLIEVLADLNYGVFAAPDARSAIGLIERKENRIDLLLCDVILPGVNGRELARRAKNLRPGLKVLFMTGYSRDAIIQQGQLRSWRSTDRKAGYATAASGTHSRCPRWVPAAIYCAHDGLGAPSRYAGSSSRSKGSRDWLISPDNVATSIWRTVETALTRDA